MSEAKEYATGVGSGALAGAGAGAALGPYGAAVGAVVGGGVGAYSTYMGLEDQKKEEERQAALERDLNNPDPLNRAMEAYALGHRQQVNNSVQMARETANRHGLSPEAAAQLEIQANNLASEQYSAALPSVFEAAANADISRRNETLNEYTTAQSLADGSATDRNAQFAQLAEAAQLGAQLFKNNSTQKVPGVQQQAGVQSPWDQPVAATPVAQPSPQANDWVQTADMSGNQGYWSETRQVFVPGSTPPPTYGASAQTPSISGPATMAQDRIGAGGPPSPMGVQGGAAQGQLGASIGASSSEAQQSAFEANNPWLTAAVDNEDWDALLDFSKTPSQENYQSGSSLDTGDNLAGQSTIHYVNGPNGEAIPMMVYQPSSPGAGYDEWKQTMIEKGMNPSLLTPDAYDIWTREH